VKKILLIIAVLAIAGGAYAADPTNILIKSDDDVGGAPFDHVWEDAATSLWSGANVEVYYNDTFTAFITALVGDTWDIVIVDAFNIRTIVPADFTDMAGYFTGGGNMYYSSWGMKLGGDEETMMNTMGASYAGSFYASPSQHYAWDAGHDICDGITDWMNVSHGASKGTWGINLNADSATPVTGWTASETAGRAGICISPDNGSPNGYSIVSGLFVLAMPTGEDAALAENILDFMWDDDIVSIKSASLGEIKATFK